ncbi:hypothetical protein [Natrarchaeobaculum sulfurireducens]|uniref:Uncharacterized protein n=1 Tax=Natrarchaeobaculum sulfurireducens TaxID=2044521 RepID=A0A346PUF4_9EURY|nr:hypothetical protein [Natrarchaeobaculum sulfurireducens]AXR83149.1 hypothetical protein AArcMg_3164 [Natrarchaeobaculum sulfurireducens]
MLSRENRVIGASVALLVAIALVVLPVAEDTLGLALSDQPLAAFVLFAGLAVLGPQLYLARTDEEISPRTRVRFAVVVSAVFALTFAEPGAVDWSEGTALLADLETLQHAVLVVVAVGSLVGLVCYEFVAGYRDRVVST